MAIQFLHSVRRHPSARKYPIGVLRRYLYWQLRRRIVSTPLVFDYVNHTKLVARKGWPVSTASFYFGLHEFETMAFMGHFLRPDDVFVDVGAHIGTYTVCAASVGSHVVAVEPSPQARTYLKEHVAINGFEQLVAIHAVALGSEVGYARIHTDMGQQNHIDVNSTNTEEVPLNTLDYLTGSLHPAAIKIDVEGYEFHVLKGARETLSDTSLSVVCIETMELGHRYGTNDEDVMSTLAGYGFQSMDYDPHTRRLSPSPGRKSMHVMVRNKERVLRRLQSAPALLFKDMNI